MKKHDVLISGALTGLLLQVAGFGFEDWQFYILLVYVAIGFAYFKHVSPR